MNGVISGSVSAGSSHRVASVTCAPHVTVPLGCAAEATPATTRVSIAMEAIVPMGRFMDVSSWRTDGRASSLSGASPGRQRSRRRTDHPGATMSGVPLLVKVLLTPALIAAATLLARRYGPAVGGTVAGLPLTSTPVSIFLFVEQGPAFTVRAA